MTHKTHGEIKVQAPSNIAFVKYWGKTGRQYPLNPSISMTLSSCVTKMRLRYNTNAPAFSLDQFLFDGTPNPKFENRITAYQQSIQDACPVLKNLNLSIETENTFPHSAGIASSASAFAALGYALAYIENAQTDIKSRASFLARLGSGSAARSLDGPFMIWGDYAPEKSSNDYAQKISNIHPAFEKMRDCILILDRNEKTTSSSAGHSLMQDHPFAQGRIDQANNNTAQILNALKTGDWESFGNIVETEALTLHALMMTSNPSYILLKPASLSVIEKIRIYRAKTGAQIYFTIDAGPNIHVIYPDKAAQQIEDFIQSELVPLCQNGHFIKDRAGEGAHATFK